MPLIFKLLPTKNGWRIGETCGVLLPMSRCIISHQLGSKYPTNRHTSFFLCALNAISQDPQRNRQGLPCPRKLRGRFYLSLQLGVLDFCSKFSGRSRFIHKPGRMFSLLPRFPLSQKFDLGGTLYERGKGIFCYMPLPLPEESRQFQTRRCQCVPLDLTNAPMYTEKYRVDIVLWTLK